MKQKIFVKKLRPLLATAFMLLIGQFVWAYDVVSYALTSTTISTSADIPANAGKNFTTTAYSNDGLTANTISFASGSAQTSKWDAATPGGYKCWQTAAFSTEGYHTIGVSATMRSDNGTGPRDFQLQYSLNGGSNWSPVNNITLTASFAAKTATLPVECQNQPSVMLRWINTSNVAVGGLADVTATAKSYIKTVSIGGLLPITPATQAHDLFVISRTPTTITVGWTKGVQADSVVLMMNTVNDFAPLPVDDQIFTPMTGMYTSGRQVVYVGTKSTFTVSVPSATDKYYFRAFDYQPNNGMTRYITTSSDDTPAVSNNPIICDLEHITLKPTTFGLIRATLTANIESPQKYPIWERGIYWSTTPNVSELNGTPLIDYEDAAGDFSFPNEIVDRGTTIYVKGYVTTEIGTIWTEEASFTNVPVFTGTGDWEDNTKWNVNEVPGANGDPTYGSVDDSPIIRGNCTINASNNVTNLTVESGRKLTINPETKLGIAGILTNSAGTSGLLIKSNSTKANGSLIFDNPGDNSNVPASVEMYSKSYWDTQYHWQYFGIPVQSTTVGATFTTSGNRVRKYDESNIDPTLNDIGLWKPAGSGNSMSAGEALVPVDGYEVVKPSVGTYTFKGNLFVDNISRTLAYTSGADWAGNNIYANPYTAAMDIKKISYGAGTEAAVYLYNTGSREEWNTNVLAATAGTYDVSTAETAGQLGVPSQIPSMQGFLVKTASTNNTNATFGYAYSNLTNNNEMQRVRANALKVGSRIDVTGSNSADKMWIFTDANCSRDFDNGWDGRKIVIPGVTQLYAVEGDGEYQIDAVNDINNVTLGFRPNNAGTFKLVFTHQNADNLYSRVYLVDLKKNTSVDVTSNGVEYDFEATPNDELVRFKILTTTTGNEDPALNSNVKVFSANSSLFVDNKTTKSGNVVLYNLSGVEVSRNVVNPNAVTTIEDLQQGTYVVKTIIGNDKHIERIIIR